MSLITIKRIKGYDVTFLRMTHLKSFGDFVNAYVKLPKSKKLSEEELGYPSWKDGDVVGVDTAHSFNETHNYQQRLLSAEHQIEYVITRYKEMIRK